MSSYNYFKPFYLPSFQPIYPLASFGDFETMFFTLKYRIRPERFVSKTKSDTIFPKLEVMFDYRGNPVVPSWVDRSKYRLLQEQVSFNQFYCEVVETYGYTPEKTFEKKNITAWTRPALEASKSTTSDVLAVDSYDNNIEDKTHTFNFTTNVHRANVGYVITITSSPFELKNEDGTNTVVWQNGTSIIKSITDNSIQIENFELRTYSSDFGEIDSVNSFDEKSALFNGAELTIEYEIPSVFYGLVQGVVDVDKRIKFPIQNNAIMVGDKVQFTAPFMNFLLYWFYAYRSDLVEVVDVIGDYFYVEDFNTINTTGIVGNMNFSEREQQRVYVSLREIGGRPAFSGDFVGDVITTFEQSNKPPNLSPKWQATKGRSFVDSVSEGSVPTIAEYQNMITEHKQLLAQPQSAQKLIGDIYTITSVYVDAQ